ncbi:MAG: ABC transporter permease, partial [Desulfoplanes sp.]
INLVALLVTALSVARERELGTYEQLLVSPLRPTEILLGKAVPAIILGFIEGVLMVALLLLIFRIPFTGSLLLLLLAMFLFLVAIVGVGLFISSLSKTQQQGFLGAFTYMVPAVLLSGFATPVANIPLWLRWLAYLNPLHYMISLTRAIFLENPDAAGVMHMIWPLLPIGLITLTGATWMFRKRME